MTKAEHDVSPLAAYLRECHAAMGSPSMRQIAEHIGISVGGIHMVLAGQRIPRPDTLAPLAKYLGADLAKACALAGSSRPGPGTSLARKTALRELADEVARLREAVIELTDTMRQAR